MRGGNVELVRVLLEAGADPLAEDHDGHTAIEVAAARAEEADGTDTAEIDRLLREAAQRKGP